jgi:hypothetical protein
MRNLRFVMDDVTIPGDYEYVLSLVVDCFFNRFRT